MNENAHITDNTLRRYLGLDVLDVNGCNHDKRGRFCKKSLTPDNKDGNSSSQNEEMQEENMDDKKQQKIASVKIDFSKDNILPELNEEDLAELGKPSKPVLVSRRMLERNKSEHPDLDDEEYSYMIAKALYDPDYVFPANPEKTSYYHFISNLGDKYHSGVILELSDNKNNYETVHVHKLRNKSVRTLLKKKKD